MNNYILVLELHVDDVELANKGKLTVDEICSRD